MKISRTKQAIIALVIANIIWGAGPPIFKWAFVDIPIFTLAFLRYIIPLLLISIFGYRYIPVEKKDIPLILLSGFLGITLNIAFYYIGIQYTASINAAIIASAAPVFLIFASILFLKERPNRKVLLGNLVGITGILFIVIEPVLVPHTINSLKGNILLVFSTFAVITNTIFAKELIRKYHPVTLIFWLFLVGALSFFPFFFFITFHLIFLLTFTFQGIFGILYGAFFASLLAWLLFLWALKYFMASETTIFDYVDPLAAIVVAAPLVHEYPSPMFFFGSLLVFFGIYIAEGRIHWHPLHMLFKKD
jgi:drug/metabolite transporter (DMT)-like permease